MYCYRNPEDMKERVEMLLRKYNVMKPEQVSAFFPGEEKAALRAAKKLEQLRQLYRNPYTGLYASSEFAYSLKDEGTISCLWVLADMLKKKPVESHFLAGKEDYPVRILFLSNQELYEILFVGEGDVKLVNGLFEKKSRKVENSIIAVENPEVMKQTEVPGAIGYCMVEDGGRVHYYRRRET